MVKNCWDTAMWARIGLCEPMYSDHLMLDNCPRPWWRTHIGDALRCSLYTFTYHRSEPTSARMDGVCLVRRDPRYTITVDMAMDWLATVAPALSVMGQHVECLYALLEYAMQAAGTRPPYSFAPQPVELLCHPVVEHAIFSLGATIDPCGWIVQRRLPPFPSLAPPAPAPAEVVASMPELATAQHLDEWLQSWDDASAYLDRCATLLEAAFVRDTGKFLRVDYAMPLSANPFLAVLLNTRHGLRLEATSGGRMEVLRLI